MACQRLNVGSVAELRIRHDGGGIRVHQDHSITIIPEGLTGLGPGVIELAGLANYDGPGSYEQYALKIIAAWHGLSD